MVKWKRVSSKRGLERFVDNKWVTYGFGAVFHTHGRRSVDGGFILPRNLNLGLVSGTPRRLDLVLRPPTGHGKCLVYPPARRVRIASISISGRQLRTVPGAP